MTPNGDFIVRYDKVHRLLAEGDFVLTVSEGVKHGVHSSFYDLFHVSNLKLVEHWDTTDTFCQVIKGLRTHIRVRGPFL